MHAARLLLLAALALGVSCHPAQAQAAEKTKAKADTNAKNAKPRARLKALLVTGGCCHDYKRQHEVLYKGIQARANVQVDVFWTDDRSTNPPLPLYDDPEWAAGYDVIIHDECAASNRNLKTLQHILDVHQKIPAIHLHCAMHSFRTGTDKWFRHLGLQSSGHGPQRPIEIQFIDPGHPIVKPLRNWTTINEELYNNVKLFGAHPIAVGTQKRGNKSVQTVVAWTNEKSGARTFSTTIGHNTATVADPRYLDMVTRGLLWSCNKLNDEHLKPYKGPNKITFVKAKAGKAGKAGNAKGKGKGKGKRNRKGKGQAMDAAPKGATLVVATASTIQGGRDPWMAIDGNPETRWCAVDDSKPQWLQLDLGKSFPLEAISIVWEKPGQRYLHRIEGSVDGKGFRTLADATKKSPAGDSRHSFAGVSTRFIKITITGARNWASLFEVTVKAKGLKSIFPKNAGASGKGKKGARARRNARNDPYARSGNVKPRIVKLTAAEEAAIMADVKVPPEFDVTLFAPAATANYPVYVAASPAGDLYVSSDGNGSLGRNPDRGRVLRLRDTDGDGRADQVTEFVANVDSPRGLVWDHDRLYLLHPPHISVHFDRDGDGVAEESKRLITGIAFGFDKRPADHTTNGLELGIDGWIYIAGGDFGFLDAVGTDGRHLQHRGGGVIRFRPDGSGLEIFATGTRNILGTPMSPLLDMFARDNTNDGGGWDVRLHYFSGLEDHGYPRLYKNFRDEHVQPLADYGGGSGCGSVYIHEPGFPGEWNHAPFTCDWGRASLYRHTVARRGSTFAETSAPKTFVKMTRPTDADVDGMSHVYQASWKGPATFNWKGPDVGYIVRVSPKGYRPTPLPAFDELSTAKLIALLGSPSHIRALTAQRTLLRRPDDAATTRALVACAGDRSKELRARVAALYAITQRGVDSRRSAAVAGAVAPLLADEAVLPFVVRALGDMGIDRRTRGEAGPAPLAAFVASMKSSDPRTRVESIIGATRQGLIAAADQIAASLGDADAVIAHTAFRALAMLNASDACFAILDRSSASEAQRRGAAHALMRMHSAGVVTGLVDRLASGGSLVSRKPMLSALCRLYHREGEWKGASWGTRPDTRGPYYQLVAWKESPRILTALIDILNAAGPIETAFLVGEMSRNRVPFDRAIERVIEFAIADATHAPVAIAQLATVKSIPARAVPMLLAAARNANTRPEVLAQVVACLARVDHWDALPATLGALAMLENGKGSRKVKQAGRNAFLKNGKLASRHIALAKCAATNVGSGEARWAHAGLLELASRKNVPAKARAHATQTIGLAWQNSQRRAVLMDVAARHGNHFLDARINAARKDSDPVGAKAGRAAAKRLRIPAPGADKSAKIHTLQPAEALARVVKFKGDPALGEAVFIRGACATCHTVDQSQAPKGPFLGNIASIYRRRVLAESILMPNKTIAQGFATQYIELEDETTLVGFAVKEAGKQITLRDVEGKEHVVAKSQIAERETLETSVMPLGLMSTFTVKEVASLLDYLEGLAKK